MADVIGQAAAAAERELPPFAALRAFEALIRLGGVRHAARNLGVHHSVVSRHVTHLEGWLGVPLLKRSGKRVTLCEGAEEYYSRISAAIAEIAQATSEIMGAQTGKPIRIWCSPSLSIQWLAREIAEFEEVYPDYRIEVKPSDTPANLQVHEADINIYFHRDDDPHPPGGSGLKFSELARPQPLVAASPAFAGRHSEIGSPADLLKLPLLHGNQKDEWASWLRLNGVAVPAELPGELCWNAHMALEAARLGRGIVLATHFFLDRELDRGDLVELMVPGIKHAAYGTYLFTAREDRWSTPAILTVRKYLSERMKSIDAPHWR